LHGVDDTALLRNKNLTLITVTAKHFFTADLWHRLCHRRPPGGCQSEEHGRADQRAARELTSTRRANVDLPACRKTTCPSGTPRLSLAGTQERRWSNVEYQQDL
jgi:hypothetical protein